MKKKGVVFAVFLLVAVMAIGTASAVNLVDVDATCDVNITYKIADSINASESIVANLKLPTTLSNIDAVGSGSLTIYAGSNDTTVNVIVNGVTVASGYTILGGTSKSWSLSDFANSGVDLNTADLNIVISAISADTSSIWFNASADDAVCSGTYFNVVVTETKTSTPELEYYDTDSFYTVKQTVNITQTSDFDITDVKLTYTYPSNAISKDVTSDTVATLNSSESYVRNLYFQKRGPYVTDIEYDEGNETYTTTITIYSPEALTADITIPTTEYPWYRYFPYFDVSRIKVIELNDEDLEWDSEDNELVLGLNDLSQGDNTLEIVYFKPSEGPVIVPQPEEQQFLGLPLWLWGIIAGATIAGVLIYVFVIRKR